MPDIISLITNDEKLKKCSIPELEAYTEKYPYCQTGHLLLLLKHRIDKGTTIEKLLTKASAYSHNRFNLLSMMGNRATVDADTVDKADDTKMAPITENSTPVANDSTKNLTEKEPKEATEENKESESEPLTTQAAQEEEKPKDEDAKTRADKMQEILDKRLEEINNEKEEKQKNAESEEDKKQIVDNFIKNEPRIKPNKNSVSDKDLSEKSVEDNLEFVSETLAQIYAGQGNYEKAIKTYEKLSLKYPEKNATFAAEIEKLKNKLKNN